MGRRFAAMPAVALLASAPVPPAAADEPSTRLVDRVVAVVDEDPIFLSELERAVALDLTSPREDESRDVFRRRVLERLVDERLRLHEVDRYEVASPPPSLVDAQLDALRERLGGDTALRLRLREAGATMAALRHLLSQQLRVVAFVEERLGPRVVVDREDVRAHYDGELAAELAARGVDRPPLEEVEDAIRILLRERRLDEEITEWTADLRRRADVEVRPEPVSGPLPPVVLEIR